METRERPETIEALIAKSKDHWIHMVGENQLPLTSTGIQTDTGT